MDPCLSRSREKDRLTSEIILRAALGGPSEDRKVPLGHRVCWGAAVVGWETFGFYSLKCRRR